MGKNYKKKIQKYSELDFDSFMDTEGFGNSNAEGYNSSIKNVKFKDDTLYGISKAGGLCKVELYDIPGKQKSKIMTQYMSTFFLVCTFYIYTPASGIWNGDMNGLERFKRNSITTLTGMILFATILDGVGKEKKDQVTIETGGASWGHMIAKGLGKILDFIRETGAQLKKNQPFLFELLSLKTNPQLTIMFYMINSFLIVKYCDKFEKKWRKAVEARKIKDSAACQKCGIPNIDMLELRKLEFFFFSTLITVLSPILFQVLPTFACGIKDSIGEVMEQAPSAILNLPKSNEALGSLRGVSPDVIEAQAQKEAMESSKGNNNNNNEKAQNQTKNIS